MAWLAIWRHDVRPRRRERQMPTDGNDQDHSGTLDAVLGTQAGSPTQEDLSLGWGHNSQWGTDFRRDYEDAEHFYFNVDGAVDLRIPLSEQQEVWDGLADLSLDARRELLVHRCFVKCPLRHDDRWPYADTLVVAKNLPL
jgi:hypothetical protein